VGNTDRDDLARGALGLGRVFVFEVFVLALGVDEPREEVESVDADVRVVDAEEVEPGALDGDAADGVVEVLPAERVGEEALESGASSGRRSSAASSS
jgi:hypothetical protein